MKQDSARWISTFLEAQAAELGAATNTLLAYGRDLKDFADWLEGRSGLPQPAATMSRPI
jgi:integrase/recombinase XerD